MKMQMGRIDGDCPDMLIFYGDDTPRCDRALLFNMLCSEKLRYNNEVQPSFIDELKARGYDMDTFRFSIERKQQPEPNSGEG